MHHDVATDPSNLLLPRARPSLRAGALARHDRDHAWRLLPLYSESGTYREWVCTVDRTEYTVVDEDGTWTLLRYEPHCGMWETLALAVDTFLRAHHLLLAD